MSLNTAHANNGVLIFSGECILLYSDNVTIEFNGQDRPEFKGSKSGRLYLTTHRMIFNNLNVKDPLLSFSFPFNSLKEVELEQPMFGANYIKGKVRAQPNGGWVGEAKFKLHFKRGGAIEYGQAMLHAAALVSRNNPGYDAPPAYEAPMGTWYSAPSSAYAPPPTGYYGWVPPTDAFPTAPQADSVFMTDMPPPYPGLNTKELKNRSGHDSKAAEAALSGGTAYYDPNTNFAYVPPPYTSEAPPSYDEGMKNAKKFQ